MKRLGSHTIPAAILLAGTALILGTFGTPGLATTSGDALGKLPGSLDAMLEEALQRNPEILVMHAKLREAQAELNQARLAVTQQVVRLHFRRQEQRKIIVEQSEDLKRVDQMYRAGTVHQGEVRKISIALAQAEGALAGIEADLRYAIGAGGFTAADLSIVSEPADRDESEEIVEAPQVPESIASVIDSNKIQVSFEQLPLSEVLSFLSQVSGLNFLISPGLEDEEILVTLQFGGEITLRQLFHAIADVTDVSFAVREYGFLAVYSGDHPEGSPVIPPFRD